MLDKKGDAVLVIAEKLVVRVLLELGANANSLNY
jgi:hypothetical protein